MSDWPFLLSFIRRHRGRQLALCTLVSVEGSSYRMPGARMLVAEDLSWCGSLSGGCLEEGIAAAAREVFADKVCRTMIIDTRPHFGCPGKLHVLVEPMPDDLGMIIGEAIATRRHLTLVTDRAAGTRTGSAAPEGGLLETITPPVRLIAIGWTADMEPVMDFAAKLGWDVHRIVRDPRMIAETPSIAGETVSVVAAGDLAAAFPPDPQTAVLVMTHHLATDLSFLRHVLPAGYGYTGLLGSKRRRETLLGELGELGLLEDTAALERLHAPVGLDLGGRHPATIALSVIAEIQAVLAGAAAGFLRDKKGTIHSLPATAPTH